MLGSSQDLSLHGLEEIEANFQLLSKRVAGKVNRDALKAAVKPVEAAMIAKCPVGKGPEAGLLKRSIGTVVRTKKGIQTAVTGPRRGFKVPAYVSTRGKNKGKVTYKIATRYGHLVEFGTSHSKAQPFVRPAWDAEGGSKSLERYVKKLDEGVKDAVARMKKRTK